MSSVRDLHSLLINTEINRPLKLSVTPASSAACALEDQARWPSQAASTHNVCSVALGFRSMASWPLFRRLEGGGSRFSTIHLFCRASSGINLSGTSGTWLWLKPVVCWPRHRLDIVTPGWLPARSVIMFRSRSFSVWSPMCKVEGRSCPSSWIFKQEVLQKHTGAMRAWAHLAQVRLTGQNFCSVLLDVTSHRCWGEGRNSVHCCECSRGSPGPWESLL